MADEPTKNPSLTTDAEVSAENERRKKAIEQLQKGSVEQIRQAIACTLDGAMGRAMTQKAGELLYVRKSWLIRPADKREFYNLIAERSNASYSFMPSYPMNNPLAKWKEIDAKLDAIYRRGSDHLRAAVGKAAAWASVPPELLAAVLQNENSPKASGWQRAGQAAERSLQSLIGSGSTGFGNVKPETLSYVKRLFKTYYRKSILGPGVKDEDQNDSVETDIYHAAAALRDGLNKAWSGGNRSLNGEQLKSYVYYPYFGGVVTQDVAVRAMGHYNGMGDAAKTYGEMGLKRIQKETLFFILHAADLILGSLLRRQIKNDARQGDINVAWLQIRGAFVARLDLDSRVLSELISLVQLLVLQADSVDRIGIQFDSGRAIADIHVRRFDEG